MFITCSGCKTPFTCTDNDECGLETIETNRRDAPEELWKRIYPDRRPWDELEPATREEWRRFTEEAFKLFQEKPHA